ncbi:protein kinase domain-containing protein, partial [Haematococcus lacustris]
LVAGCPWVAQVKPANFAQVPGTAEEDGIGDWRLLDFGLARRYVDDAGVPLAEREDAAFRGSTTYASVHAHAHGDLSRRDDLWSWLYLVAELIEGTLPWRQEVAVGAGGPAAGQADVGTQRDAVAAVKQACVLNPDLLTRTTRVG